MLYWVLTSCVNSAEDTGAQVEQPTQIVNWGDWKFADLETDPLRTHQPESIDCSPNAMQMEGEQLEIRTDFCNYAFLDFQANQDVSVDTTLAFLLLHTGLWAPEAATAHFPQLLLLAAYLQGRSARLRKGTARQRASMMQCEPGCGQGQINSNLRGLTSDDLCCLCVLRKQT